MRFSTGSLLWVFRFPTPGFRCREDIEKLRERRPSSTSFQISADNLNDVGSRFFRGFGIARHVIADVVFHQLGYEAVDGAAGGGEALKGFGAGIIFVQGAQNTFELADYFFGAVDEIQFFARSMRHLSCLP